MNTKANSALKHACLGIVIACAAVARADYWPIAIDTNSYNSDTVIEADTCYTPLVPNRFTTATLRTDGANDNNGVLFEVGLLPYNPTFGVPAPGSLLVSASDPTHVYQMAPSYTADNAIVLGTVVRSGIYSWVPSNPSQTYQALSFLACGYNATSTFMCTVYHADGSSEVFTLTAPKYGASTGSEAYNAQGTLQAQLFAAVTSASATCFFASDCTLTNLTSAVTNISLVHVGSVQTTILAVSGQPASGGNFAPIAGTGYNADVVIEKAAQGCLTTFDQQWWRSILTATIGNGTNDIALYAGVNSFAEIGYDPGSASTPGGPTNGMPLHGAALTSKTYSTIHYTMPATYKGLNGWMLDANPNGATLSATIVFATPTNVAGLSILHAMGAGPDNFWAITHHLDGVSETNVVTGGNTFGPTDSGSAYDMLLRVDVGNRFLPYIYTPNPSKTSIHATLWDASFALSHTSSPVDRVTLACPGYTNWGYFATRFIAYAISGLASAPVIITAQPSAFAVLTTSNASFSVGASGSGPLAYQWQASPNGVGNWTNVGTGGGRISGVSSPNLTINNVQFSDALYYRAAVTATAYAYTAYSGGAQLFVFSGDPDLAQPGDPVAIYGGNPIDANHGPEHAIDHFTHRYGNLGRNNGAPYLGPVGFVWTPTPDPTTGNSSTIVRAVRLFNNGTVSDTDPTSFMLEGSNDGGSTYKLITSNAIALPAQRNFGEGTQIIDPLSGWPVWNLYWSEVDLTNTTAYQTYRFSVPSIRNPLADRCEYGEVQFLGIVNTNPPQVFTSQPGSTNAYYGTSVSFSAAFTGTGSPVYRWARGANGVYAYLTDGGSVSGSQTPSLTVNPVSFADAADYVCIATNTLARATSGIAHLTVLTTYPNVIGSGSPISAFGDNSMGFWPNGDPNLAIDGSLIYYQNGGSGPAAASGAPPFGGPVGLVITPITSGGATNATLVRGLRLFPSGPYNPELDPADYTLEGSNDGGNTFSLISSGALALPAARNDPDTGVVDVLSDSLQELLFPYNNQAYSVYRLTFHHTKNDSLANCLQIAEVQLLGVAASVVPVLSIHPGTLAGTITISSSVPAELYSRTNLVQGNWVDEGAISGSVTITPNPATPAKFYRAGVAF